MNELSERARLVVSGLVKGILDAERTVPYCDLDSKLGLSFAMPLIEQALLAERKSVWAEAALLVETAEINIGDHYGACYAPSADGALLASKLRAAAEGE